MPTFHIRRSARYGRVDTRLTSGVAILRVRVPTVPTLEPTGAVAVHAIPVVGGGVVAVEALLHALDVVRARVGDVGVVLAGGPVDVGAMGSFGVFDDPELERGDAGEESGESEKEMNHCEKRVMKTLELYLKARRTTTTTSSTE